MPEKLMIREKEFEEENGMKKKTPGFGEYTLQLLTKNYTVTPCDLGSDAKLSKKGFHFETEAYDVSGLGHLCIMKMKGLAGLMRMETVVLAVTDKDVPLYNVDWIGAMGRETQIMELYNDQISFQPDSLLQAFQKIKDRDAEITDYTSDEAHWYDDILYPCSYAKKGKKVSARLHRAARDCTRVFLARAAQAPSCDPEVKKEKVRSFAETLYSEGGPAVDMLTQLFGEETAKRVILGHMYGLKDPE